VRPSAPRGLGGDQVEGRQAVRELLLAGRRRVREISIEADLEPSPILRDIVELAADQRVPIHEVGATKLRSLARTEAPQGVVARAQPLPEADLDALARDPHALLLAFDGVTDPGNLGAALRSAEGAGVTGVVLPRHRAAHISPTVTKAAAGAVEHLSFALVSGMPSAISQLRDLGVWVVGLDATGDRPIHDLDIGAAPVALVMGAEDRGLSRLARQRCDQLARIPLRGQLASLNVAAAAAVAVFEVRRQRDAAR
jgi:23S rRNA (guanosine2251-2'-O)-methyltransferase